MRNYLAKRMEFVLPSPTLAITALAASLKEQGKDIIGFGAGEPDFDTPEIIKKAAAEALFRGETKYSAVSGITPLKEAIVEKLAKEQNLVYQPSQVIVSNGGKQALYNFFMATLNPDDEVIIPAPYWVSYRDMVVLAEGKPVLLNTELENQFKIKPEELQKAISPKTKVFVINSPCNPTGVAYTKEELLEIARILENHEQILILTDDIYEKLLFDGKPFYNLAMISPTLFSRTIIVNGFSKAYSMTGWRLGYAVSAQSKIIEAMDTIQGQTTSNVSTFSQYGAIQALKEGEPFIEEMKKEFVKRRNFVMEKLSQMQGLRLVQPDGAFYVFPEISYLSKAPGFEKLKKENPNEQDNGKLFAQHLLEKYLVAVVPGSAFGYENGFRISYATSMEKLNKGLNRLGECIAALWK